MLPLINLIFLVLLTVRSFPAEKHKTKHKQQQQQQNSRLKNRVVQLSARLRPLVAADGNMLQTSLISLNFYETPFMKSRHMNVEFDNQLNYHTVRIETSICVGGNTVYFILNPSYSSSTVFLHIFTVIEAQ